MLTNILKLYLHFSMMILMLLGIQAVLPMNIEETKQILKNFKKLLSSKQG